MGDRGITLAALVLVAALGILRLSASIASYALPLLWLFILFLAGSTRRRTFLASAAVLGFLVINIHFSSFGSQAAHVRMVEQARAKMSDLFDDVLKKHELNNLASRSRNDLFALTDRLIADAPPGAGMLIRAADGTPLAWGGEVTGKEMLPQGTWLELGEPTSFLRGRKGFGAAGLEVSLPLPIWTARDTMVRLNKEFSGLERAEQSTLVPEELLILLITGFLLLLFAELHGAGRRRTAAILVLAWRGVLHFMAGEGALVQPEKFASGIPLAQTAGDILLSSIAVFCVVLLIPCQIRRPGRWRYPLLIWYAGAAAGLGLGIAAVPGWVRQHMSVSTMTIHRLVLHPSILALALASLLLCMAAGRLVAVLPRPRRGELFAIICLMIMGIVVMGWQWGVAILLIVISLLWSAPALWPVARWTGVALAASAFMIPAWNHQFSVLRKDVVEDLAEQVASPGVAWFRLLAEEVFREGTGAPSIHDMWANGPLARLPVSGELLWLDEQCCVEDRLAFGLTGHEIPELPMLPPKEKFLTWVDAFDELDPPMSKVTSVARRDGGTGFALVSLVADMASPILLGGAGMLADGSPWPLSAHLTDRGLLSGLDPGEHAVGWHADRATGSHYLGFQREFADGPHLLTLTVEPEPVVEQVVAYMAWIGMICLIAQLTLAARNMWMAPSVGSLFFKFRDRLLPFMLATATPPVLVILILGPWLEDKVLQGQETAEAQMRLDETAARFRNLAVEHARAVARRPWAAPIADRWRLGERIAQIDHTGNVVAGSLDTVSAVSPALLTAVQRRQRPLVVIPRGVKRMIAVVPGENGAVVVDRPLHMMAGALAAGATDLSIGVWQEGMLAAAALSPPCDCVPFLLPDAPVRLSVSRFAHGSVRAADWNFKVVSDDVRDAAVIIGVRSEQRPRGRSLWVTVEVWGLGILFPVLALIVFLSSAAARLVTRPVSILTDLAQRVEGGTVDTKWPAPSGELGHLSKALERMTERLLLSRMDIERRRAYLQTVLEQITSSVIVVGPDGMVELTNRSAESLLHWLLPHGVAGDLSVIDGPLGDVVGRVLATGRSAEQSIALKDDAVTRQWHVGVAALGVQGHEAALGVVIVADETTELAERERLLAWAEFAREMAHEIKNPLTPMKLAAQHLRKAHASSSPRFDAVLRQATDMIERQATRIEGIVKEFSMFTKATGKEFVVLDLCTVVSECLGDYRYAMTESVELCPEFEEPEIRVRGDREALRKVVANLLDNALRAVGNSGSVKILVALSGNTARLECIDTGPGIPKEMREKVFEPGVTERPGGMGLGLTICRSLVAAHGGRIRIESEDEGGTRVIVELPCAPEE